MATQKEVPKVVPTGAAFLKTFLKTRDGKRSLVIPEDKAQLFVETFLKTEKACDNLWVEKFMTATFGHAAFDVAIKVKVAATATVRVTASSRADAKKQVEAMTKIDDNDGDHNFDFMEDGNNYDLSDIEAVETSEAK